MQSGSAHFELVTREEFPPERYCTISEENGNVTVRFLQGDASSLLCDELNEWHKRILGAQLWGREDEAESILEARAVAVVRSPKPAGRFQLVPEGALPTGSVCHPVDHGHEFIWQIHEHHMTERLCSQLNVALARVMREGNWAPWE